MTLFRGLLVLMTLSIVTYTMLVGINHGWNLLPYFVSEMMMMTWQGQFNFDFSCFLVLSGLWTIWRNEFTPLAYVLGLVAAVRGIMFLAPYLLFLSFKEQADAKTILIGHNR